MRLLRLRTEGASAVVDSRRGGRLASLRVAGLELLVTDRSGPTGWGSFPMVPFAGRVRDGRFSWAGKEHQLPRNHGAHAMHGTVFSRPWDVVDAHTITTDLGPVWPFRGHVEQRFDLRPDRLRIEMEVHGDEPMPVSAGWHPWFRRRLERGDPVHLWLDAAFMDERGPDHLPTGEQVAPTPGPWDDCFGGLARPPILRWDHALEVEVASSCDRVVVFDELAHAICVEPQTHPPDALRHRAAEVRPGVPLTLWMELRWRRLPPRTG